MNRKKCAWDPCNSWAKDEVHLYHTKTKERKKILICKKHYPDLIFRSSYDTSDGAFIQEKLIRINNEYEGRHE